MYYLSNFVDFVKQFDWLLITRYLKPKQVEDYKRGRYRKYHCFHTTKIRQLD